MKYKNILLLVLFMTSAVYCVEAQQDTIYMDEIIIVGKQPNNLLRSQIIAESWKLKNIHDVGEIFNAQPGFGVIKRGNYAMEPVLRGYKEDQVNTQFNTGATSSNACPNRMDPAISQIAPEEIEKIEVIKGPYSVRYGQSFGGTVNIISNKAENSDQFKIKGSAKGGFISNGTSGYGELNLLMTDRKYFVLLNANYKDFGNYKSGDGKEIPSSFRRFGYSARFLYNLTENQHVQITWRQGYAKDILHAGLPMDADKDNSSMLSIDYQGLNLSPTLLSFKAKLFGSYVDHEMSNDLRPNYKAIHARTPVTATVYGGRAELGLQLTSKDIAYIGADYKHVNKDGKRTREVYVNVCTGAHFDPPKVFQDYVWQDSGLDDLGIFLENRSQISPRLLWIIGIRLDLVAYAIHDPAPDFQEYYPDGIDPDTRLTTALNTSLNWQVTQHSDLEWAVGRGVHSPELHQLFIDHMSIGKDAYEYVGNPNLKSEINYQTDLKFTQRFGIGSAFGNVFYSYLNDYITAKVDTTLEKKFIPCQPPTHAKRYENIDKAFMVGFEAGFDIRFLKNFIYILNGSYTYAQNVSWDEPLSEIPPFRIMTSLGYRLEKLEALLSAHIVSAQNRVAESFNESTTPGYATFDVSVDYKPLKFLEIFGSVTNIFDKNYADHLSRAYVNMDEESLYYEPGRSFNVGIKVSF